MNPNHMLVSNKLGGRNASTFNMKHVYYILHLTCVALLGNSLNELGRSRDCTKHAALLLYHADRSLVIVGIRSCTAVL